MAQVETVDGTKIENDLAEGRQRVREIRRLKKAVKDAFGKPAGHGEQLREECAKAWQAWEQWKHNYAHSAYLRNHWPSNNARIEAAETTA